MQNFITLSSMRLQSVRRAIHSFPVMALMLFATGCSQSGLENPGEQLDPDLHIQPVSGKTEIGADWKDIVPPSPLQVVENEQSIRLRLTGIEDMTHSNSLILTDGREITFTAVVIDDQGSSYPLSLGGIAGDQHAYFYRAGEYPPGPDFDVDRTIVKLRLKSDLPLELDEIQWVCTTTH
jgi:hypothetical protein